MTYKTIKDDNFTDKTVLIRADINVPTKDGKVTDNTRIVRLKGTIDHLLSQNAKIVIMSHMGRPKGQASDELSLKFLQPVLENVFKTRITFANDCIGDVAKEAISSAQFGEIVLLENLRFHMGEERNDTAFAQRLAENGDVFVNDAFSVSHRAHASVEGITQFLPSYAGLLMHEELHALETALEKPERPVLAVVGGSKISTKLDLLNNMIKKVNVLILGGAMANTFLYAQGNDMGASMCEKDMAQTARDIMENSQELGCDIILPSDGVVAETVEPDVAHQTKPIAEISGNDLMLDAGAQSLETFKSRFNSVKTVLWNGPLGVFEVSPFDKGTNELAQHAAKLVKNDQIKAIAGGGDTVAAVSHAGVKDGFTYVSSAGGAFLEWLEGKSLPGVAALESSNAGDGSKKVAS